MSGDDQGSNDSAPETSTGGPAPGTEQPRIDLGRVHRGLASLIRQGVVRPNGGDHAPPVVQVEDDDGGGVDLGE